MFSEVKEWLIRDYRIPKQEGVQFTSILILTGLIFLLTLSELIVDFKATNLPFMLIALGLNMVILIIARYARHPRQIQIVGNVQLILLYLLFEVSFFMLPNAFHAYIYWMPAIPLLALIFGNLRISYTWLLIIIFTLFGNMYYGWRLYGEYYVAEIPYLSYAIAGSIFALTLVICFSLLYGILGRSYNRLKKKNIEVVDLIHQLKQVNGSLEARVDQRTADIARKNERLRDYAFMNSHLVRAPLANILGALIALEGNNDKKTQRELLSMVRKSAEDMDKQIKKIAQSLAEDKI